MTAHRSRSEKVRRRFVSVPALTLTCVLLSITMPVWLPIAVVVDAVRLRWRFPLARLLSFAVCWSWIEVAGVVRSAALWATGRARDDAANYRLMSWWSGALMSALRLTIGIDPHVEGLAAVEDGNAIVLSRHASLADSLLSGWVFSNVAAASPRYVLKRELLFDPCLDIVGLRVPNHFLDREATDGSAELEALRELGATVGPGSVAVIFAEGTRANDKQASEGPREDRRARPDARRSARWFCADCCRRDPRARLRFSAGHRLPTSILAWHTGFDGLDTFGGMIARLSEPLPRVRFVMRRIARSEVPGGEAFPEWLDARWLEMDAAVDEALAARS